MPKPSTPQTVERRQRLVVDAAEKAYTVAEATALGQLFQPLPIGAGADHGVAHVRRARQDGGERLDHRVHALVLL
ncbi:MAG: hypothetical protein AUH68_04240 [Gemmatimonadetes bacterium 13_1_40CM_4_69_5]|nr:MAG: hypothetical protein AUH68_04240 [Gemmatimonadetes bacterium 13_1_40CM_4_69_5]